VLLVFNPILPRFSDLLFRIRARGTGAFLTSDAEKDVRVTTERSRTRGTTAWRSYRNFARIVLP
jgi:hypothetical protein